MRVHGLWLLGLVNGTPGVPAQAVLPGIEVLLADSARLIAGKRLALLTNRSGIDRAGRPDAQRLIADGQRLIALFSPEHGFQGREDRPGLPDAVDSSTGLPIYSLYAGTRAPNLAMLDSVDIVLVDLQDIGARYYTYPPTAVRLMREAARRGKQVVVLDRPNPVGGVVVQGNIRTEPGSVDTGGLDFLPLPMRHGMTLGEMLRMANDVYGLHADLSVVPTAGWRRGMYYDDTALPWVSPSPNMPTLESALHYPGICLFEATNLSVGRGTPFAFQVIGAPWLDAGRVLAALRDAQSGAAAGLAGVRVRAAAFTPRAPTDGKYDGVALTALRLRVTDRRRYDPTTLAVALLVAIRRVHPDSFRFIDARFDQLAAGAALREQILAGRGAAEIGGSWVEPLARFRRARVKYLLY